MEAAVILSADLSVVLGFDATGGKGDTRGYPTAVLVLQFPIIRELSSCWLYSIKKTTQPMRIYYSGS